MKARRLSRKNDEYNRAHDRSDLINAQRGEGVADLRYGAYRMAYNGCELIALHNLLLLAGRKSSLAAIARFMSERGYLWSPLGLPAAFGTRLSGVPAYLHTQGIACTALRGRALRHYALKPGELCILAYLAPRLHIHTVALRGTETGLQVWNFRPRAAGCTSLSSLSEIAAPRKLLVLYRADESFAKRAEL